MLRSRGLKGFGGSAGLGLILAVACGGHTSDGGAGGSGSGSGASAGSGGSFGSGATSGTAGNSGYGGAGGVTGSSGGGAGSAGGVAGVGTFGSAGFSGASGGAGGSVILPAEWRACDMHSECVIREAQCCELCGPRSASEAVAFNGAFRARVEDMVCKGVDPNGCPIADCALPPKYLLPFCVAGSCTVVDLRETPLMVCETDSQCRLRWNTTCCEQCGGSSSEIVAVNAQVDYEAGVCSPDFAGCPPCVPPPFPAGIRARCSPERRCEVQHIAE